jgi:hypothetical protein
MAVLQLGDSGELVARLKAALQAYSYDPGPNDIFDEATEAAVRGFQESRGIAPSGVADEETLSAMDLDPDTLEDLIEIEPAPFLSATATPSVATFDGEDIYLDPPIRLWPQYDARWAQARIAGPKTGNLLNWVENGCNACTAAMILRWFAEDCTAGHIPFPTKDGGVVDPDFYGLRMGECFWPNADPPGKVELTPQGRIFYRKIYNVAAHYLKTGAIERSAKGDAVDPTDSRAYYVSQEPSEGWMELIRTLLDAGPVIVGIGQPAGHFVVAHGIVGDGLLLADPGAVLFSAYHGGKPSIANWSGKSGYVDGTMDSDFVRLPPTSQWPGEVAPGSERDARSYYHVSGQFLDDLLANLISVTSLTYSEGAMLQSS